MSNTIKHDFTDWLIEEYLTESTTLVPTSAPGSSEWFNFFDENPVAAIYTARAITYDLVKTPRSAKALYNMMERDGDWEPDELLALESLLCDALEGANYDRDALVYAHNRCLPLAMAFKIDGDTKRDIEQILKKLTRDEKLSLLWTTINTLVLNDYI